MGHTKVEISLHSDIAELEKDWRSLQQSGLCTFYQTFEWCLAWHETAGKSRGITPLIVCGRQGNDGKLIFLMPFAVELKLGARTLCWYSASEITYGMGIYDRPVIEYNPYLIKDLWPQILQKINTIDLIDLSKQPANWDGLDNPMKFLFTQKGANKSYQLPLQPDFQSLYEQSRSTSSRRSARKRDKKLLATGQIRFGLPEQGKDTHKVINTMIDQQQERLGKRGIHSVYDQTRREFLQHLAKSTNADGSSVLLPYNLSIDGEICAVMLGGTFQSTYWALVSSLTNDTKLYPLSPGDHALRATIEDLCAQNYRMFDFSAGDASYKSQWSEKTIELFESIKAVTIKGYAGTAAARLGTSVKRGIKDTPWLFTLAKSARKLLFKS